MKAKVCVVAAGGTGGHMFPAEALARELAGRGWRIVLATDHRGEAYAQAFPAEERIALDAATGRGPVGMAKAGLAIARGVVKARAALNRLDAAVVVGFGGYPSAPALLAALSQKRPTLLHEQNSVLGRTNRWLSPYVGAVASSFPNLQKVPAGVDAKVTLIGNPVRPDIRALFDRTWVAPTARGPIHVLVTGGSQGARILSEAVPQALAALPAPLRKRLRVQQQSRAEMLDAARDVYQAAGIEAEVAPFFGDMARRLATTHLVIGRAGASTCSELAVAALPSLLIPLKIAMDDHQRFNAASLAEAGGAQVVLEDDASVGRLTAALEALLSEPGLLSAMSAGARSAALPDATARLADMVEAAAADRTSPA
ncbi:MAG: undecaprenyldiphospho-muramoylpentapeptide beta-N-acetylglucosaminyltransferase [Alphaproteobacteria bacterium]|nr:undecaprenyldiphospho-muramoylpentapeptide beta-N-acetylglucosaminyltransferase [Alphaproteobacteria bacterium]MBU2042178.1 undecaprenyldiphospho-muramoylpentapeptide beta-N-acetylglucosaminyltransferase [Alphaproteobacteria bacterium]MBU2126114.1 undecaprenyldiphospho-muramoylpentapeptide beta-N-acetylglucosaminyltransferase [Alphaproteobacteria bacterium]MBU2209767.1 undecaprenyldiphospho-muramoylpentapeptide beta-N-acetylglucosaminyltransferase [Alphaproteobacteria bacterium]MBU2289867.1 